jgi:hypothetical protein
LVKAAPNRLAMATTVVMIISRRFSQQVAQRHQEE